MRCAVRSRRAFSIIELVVVLAALMVLLSLLLPAFSKAKNTVYLNQSRMQLSRYVYAMNEYVRDYGEFPRLFSENEELPSETVLILNREASKNFILALTGCELDGVTPLSDDHTYLNPEGTAYLTFSDDDFYRNSDGTIDRTRLADRFNNPNLHFIVENPTDSDVLIPKSVFGDYKTILPKVPEEGLRERVVFFTVGDHSRSLDVTSWKKN